MLCEIEKVMWHICAYLQVHAEEMLLPQTQRIRTDFSAQSDVSEARRFKDGKLISRKNVLKLPVGQVHVYTAFAFVFFQTSVGSTPFTFGRPGAPYANRSTVTTATHMEKSRSARESQMMERLHRIKDTVGLRYVGNADTASLSIGNARSNSAAPSLVA